MWTCHRCGKPVYFAERRQSLGFDWHPLCLKCEECGKILQPGQHAQHKSSPYCHIPCYAALFGPNLFGHGSTTESHRSFGNRSKSFIRLETELSNKVKDYNRYYSGYPRCQLTCRQVNGRLVLEGVLRIYWGTHQSIRLKQYEDNRVINRNKKALSLGFQYANVEYDSDDALLLATAIGGVKADDPSLFFPPQLGDLTIHVPPGDLTAHSQEHGELQKWQTLTTLDKESKPKLDVQLLESLIDDKSLKLTTRSNILQRSQSVKATSSDSKLKTLNKAKNAKKRFSCHFNEISNKYENLADLASENLNAIGEDPFTADAKDQIDGNNATLNNNNNSTNNIDRPVEHIEDTLDNTKSTIDDETNCDTNFNNDLIANHDTAEDDIENVSNADDALLDANSNPKSCDSVEDSDANEVQIGNDVPIVEIEVVNAGEEHFNDVSMASDAMNSDDSLSDNEVSESYDFVVHDGDLDCTNKILDGDQNPLLDDENGNEASVVTSQEDLQDNKDLEDPKDLGEKAESYVPKKISARRPSVEFNIYTPRNPPKIKKSPIKYSNNAELPKATGISQPITDQETEKEEGQKASENQQEAKVELRQKRAKKSKLAKGDKEEGGGGEGKQGGGPRALRRRKGGRMTRIRRRSSINGHWYDRETAVFTPPKDAAMSVWSTSLQSTAEVLSSILGKYKIESEATDFGLFVVKETGERRLLGDNEFPLLLRANLGPHEDISKFYVMNKQTTSEISDKVAEFLRFSWAELRAFLNMFYEEEEREADAIRYKYHVMRDMMQKRMQELNPSITDESSVNDVTENYSATATDTTEDIQIDDAIEADNHEEASESTC